MTVTKDTSCFVECHVFALNRLSDISFAYMPLSRFKDRILIICSVIALWQILIIHSGMKSLACMILNWVYTVNKILPIEVFMTKMVHGIRLFCSI